MTSWSGPPPTFNLWREPWVQVERHDGGLERLSLENVLCCAHELAGLYHPSPLVVAGGHRLLVAILQDALAPGDVDDLCRIWEAGCFPPETIAAFGARYAARFDLFSEQAPFLQSADLALSPAKGDNVKTVAYLLADQPSGTEITHYRHGAEAAQCFCAACAAEGLTLIPAFATSGGAGIKPSINGVPPIYVLPVGRNNLFEGLAASLTHPGHQPPLADREAEAAWWARAPLVGRSAEVTRVGYLHSLTFPARRVRLHPEPMDTPCTRCGQQTRWGVRTMIFDMGESRPKGAVPWFDPFAAYRLPDGKKRAAPTPIRPQEGKALWREYGALLMPTADHGDTKRPAILDQLAERDAELFWRGAPATPAYTLRCIGLRTDMKAKVFEWLDATFTLPSALLNDGEAGVLIREAIGFAETCSRTIRAAFRVSFGHWRKQERFRDLAAQLEAAYWAALAGPFREFVPKLAATPAHDEREALRREWAEQVIRIARDAFGHAATDVGDDAASLRERVQGEARCAAWLAKNRKEYGV